MSRFNKYFEMAQFSRHGKQIGKAMGLHPLGWPVKIDGYVRAPKDKGKTYLIKLPGNVKQKIKTLESKALVDTFSRFLEKLSEFPKESIKIHDSESKNFKQIIITAETTKESFFKKIGVKTFNKLVDVYADSIKNTQQKAIADLDKLESGMSEEDFEAIKNNTVKTISDIIKQGEGTLLKNKNALVKDLLKKNKGIVEKGDVEDFVDELLDDFENLQDENEIRDMVNQLYGSIEDFKEYTGSLKSDLQDTDAEDLVSDLRMDDEAYKSEFVFEVTI